MEERCCGLCNETVIFTRNPNGNVIVLDRTPHENGTHRLFDGVAHVHHGEMWEPMWSGAKYKEHITTCSGVKRKPK